VGGLKVSHYPASFVPEKGKAAFAAFLERYRLLSLRHPAK
jgi:hypothetical protein